MFVLLSIAFVVTSLLYLLRTWLNRQLPVVLYTFIFFGINITLEYTSRLLPELNKTIFDLSRSKLSRPEELLSVRPKLECRSQVAGHEQNPPG